MRAPASRHLGDQLLVAVAVEDAGHQVGHLAVLRAREFAQVLADRRVEIDHAVGQAAADGDLVHVDVGRVQEVAMLGQRHDGERAGAALGGERGAFQRIDGDVHRRAAGADLLADIQHRRLVHLALADHHGAVDGDGVEGAAHRLHRGAVGLVLLAEADPARGGECGCLGDAHQFECEVAVGDVAGLRRVCVHGAFLRTGGVASSVAGCAAASQRAPRAIGTLERKPGSSNRGSRASQPACVLQSPLQQLDFECPSVNHQFDGRDLACDSDLIICRGMSCRFDNPLSAQPAINSDLQRERRCEVNSSS